MERDRGDGGCALCIVHCALHLGLCDYFAVDCTVLYSTALWLGGRGAGDGLELKLELGASKERMDEWMDGWKVEKGKGDGVIRMDG
jgi:hypothetical protein